MKTILISGVSSIVGFGILKSLKKEFHNDVQIIGSSIHDETIANEFCDLFIKAPKTNDISYLSWLKETLKKYSIDFIIPGIDADVYLWANNIEEISAITTVLINNIKLIQICENKWNFYKNLESKRVDFLIPTTLSKNIDELIKNFNFPMILKPMSGYGSKGIIRVYEQEALEKNINSIGDNLMVQPLIGNDEEEYTTGVFGDGKGNFMASITLKRKLSKDGYTEKAKVTENSEILKIVDQCCKIFKPIGPTNFQFRNDNGRIKLLEINPRISSSTSIRTLFGYNEAKMSYDYFVLKKEIKQPAIKKGYAIRYIEDYVKYEE